MYILKTPIQRSPKYKTESPINLKRPLFFLNIRLERTGATDTPQLLVTEPEG